MGVGQLKVVAAALKPLIVQILVPFASITRYWLTTAEVVPAKVVKVTLFFVALGGAIWVGAAV